MHCPPTRPADAAGTAAAAALAPDLAAFGFAPAAPAALAALASIMTERKFHIMANSSKSIVPPESVKPSCTCETQGRRWERKRTHDGDDGTADHHDTLAS